jgi:hypothetical protein
MKKHTLVFLNVSFFLAFAPIQAEVSSIPQKPQATNLFIIVMNGVRFDDAFGEKNHLYIDNIWNKLRPQGTICTKFDNRELTFPVPSQMSLLTGVWHVFKNPVSGGATRPAFPTLFEYWNSAKKDAGNSCYFASNNAAFEILTSSTHAGFGSKYAPLFDASKKEDINENAIYEKALPYIMEKQPSFVYLSLGSGVGKGVTEAELLAHECQTVGEKDACGGSELLNAYYESIILMDQIVYDLWDRIQKVDAYKDKTVFLVLSDYGRHTDDFHGYGDKCRGCTQLFLLAIGPGIKKNFVSKQGRTLIDICRTVGNLYNFPTQYAKGDVMKELFE